MKKGKEHLINLIVSNKSLVFNEIYDSLNSFFKNENPSTLMGLAIQVYWVARQRGYDKYKNEYTNNWDKLKIKTIKDNTITNNYSLYLELNFTDK